MDTNYIKHPAYIDKIKPFIGKQIIKVLTGVYSGRSKVYKNSHPENYI